MKAIEIKNLTKKFGDKIAVNNLSLDIEEGELFALLGVNGAGKTTTIRILSGLSEPTEGDARILGYSILTDREKAKSSINISPQETAVGKNLTVNENLMFIATLYGFSKKEAIKKTSDMIEIFSLKEYEKKKAKVLSGGIMRRLSIAMALITDPKVLFLDEPTLGLDVLARRELWNIIQKLKGKITIILTTHYMEEAESLSDRVAIISDGQLKEVGSPEELIKKTNSKNFEDAFVSIAAKGV